MNTNTAPQAVHAIINALHRHDQIGTVEIDADLLAKEVAPKFPNVSVVALRLIAKEVLAYFYGSMKEPTA